MCSPALKIFWFVIAGEKMRIIVYCEKMYLIWEGVVTHYIYLILRSVPSFLH